MRKNDRAKIAAIKPTLTALVSAGQLESAFRTFDQALGSAEERGWGRPIDPTLDLMRRIIALRPGDEGVELAVTALIGDTYYDRKRNVWKRARYEQDIDEWRGTGFVSGVHISATEHSCRAGAARAGCYKLENAPPIISEYCTSEYGCVCYWEIIFEDELPPTPWQDLK